MEPVINVTWKIWLEMVQYLSVISSEDKDTLDQEKLVGEDEHSTQEWSLIEEDLNLLMLIEVIFWAGG